MTKNKNELKELGELDEQREAYGTLKDFQRLAPYISEHSWKFLRRNF